MFKIVKYIGIILIITMIIIPFNIIPVNAADGLSQGQDRIPPLIPQDAIKIEGRILQEWEFYHIPISEEFIINNGNKLDSPEIELSFPESWLTDPPKPFENSVTLRVPKDYVLEHDRNKSPDIVSATFFHDHFLGLPKTSPPPAPPINLESIVHSRNQGTKDIDYQERWEYSHSGDDITGAAGYLYPFQYSNPNGEDFCTYHEIEYYGDNNDVIEIVNCYWSDYNNGEPFVFFVIYRSGQLPYYTDFISVDLGDYIYYTISADYASPSHYDCSFTINNDVSPYSISDSSLLSDFDRIRPSCEIDTEGGIQNSFTAYTYNTITDLKTTSWQGGSYIPQVLNYLSANTDSYVSVWCYLGYYALYAYNLSSDTV